MLWLTTTTTRTTTILPRHCRVFSSSAAALVVDDETDSTTTSSRPIYVAATRQHVGKTSTSVALLRGLQKRFDKVGFMKPVGQQCLHVLNAQNETIPVDKDVALIRQHFQLHHLDYSSMSPVLIPRGYTKDYLNGKITSASQRALIQDAHAEIKAQSSVVLCEGTGHCAVGSIVGAGNAQVASWIGADMVLVANGGLGSTMDELELNRVFCELHGVHVAGVIINKVQPDKYEQTKHYVKLALKQEHWNDIPLLGCIPDRPFLGCPALRDMEGLFGTKLWSGQEHAFRHYTMGDLMLVATSLEVFLRNLKTKPSRTLYVCHASRHDIILGFLEEYQRRAATGEPLQAALVVSGDPSKYPLDQETLNKICTQDAPVLRSPHSTRETMELIHSHTPKLNPQDENRVNTAAEHYEPYIDFDLLLERTGNNSSSSMQTEAKRMPS